MMNKKEIVIKKIPHKKHRFCASFKHPFLKAVFSVTFCDTVYGAVVFHDFVSMIQEKYRLKDVPIIIADGETEFRNEHLLKEISQQERRA